MHLVSYYFTMSFPWRGSAVAGSSGAGEGVPPDGLPRNRIARRSRRKPTSNRTKQAARRWEGIKEQVGIRWTRLTAADLDTVGGNLERLLDLLRLRYGYDRRAAEEQIGSWSRSLPRASWARQSPGAPRVRARGAASDLVGNATPRAPMPADWLPSTTPHGVPGTLATWCVPPSSRTGIAHASMGTPSSCADRTPQQRPSGLATVMRQRVRPHRQSIA